MYNIDNIRKDFPALADHLDGKPNIYLDTAASAQKPQCVIDKICQIYQHTYANVHRGTYALAEAITAEYESARQTIASFIGAKTNEVVFTRGATESINLVAASWAQNNLKSGDEILVSEAEHHANLIPWQITAQ
ncbi:MAG TPA: cysteine desulfurase, partial [Alphaproteobacteria bacterium]|nr:cysteine desulfurase [Alphaproteobacteria bacterium]